MHPLNFYDKIKHVSKNMWRSEMMKYGLCIISIVLVIIDAIIFLNFSEQLAELFYQTVHNIN